MAKRNLNELVKYIRSTKSAIEKAHALSLLQFLSTAEGLAKRNATRQFVGRRGRKLSGRLLNSIFTDVVLPSGGRSLPTGVIGTRGIPYGAIHEFGGTIRPVKAKWLWIKQWGGEADQFRRMTPRQFVGRMKSGDRRFKILGKGSPGKSAVFQESNDSNPIQLFSLADSVTMPARPFIGPAVKEALKTYSKSMRQNIAKSFLGI